jgi:hypothetical protein
MDQVADTQERTNRNKAFCQQHVRKRETVVGLRQVQALTQSETS